MSRVCPVWPSPPTTRRAGGFTSTSPRATGTPSSRGTVSTNPDLAYPTLETILTIDQPATNHNGGCLQVGPDGYLYISSGDGGGQGDPGDNGQDLTNLLGTIPRLDVSPETGSAIPAADPYVGTNGLDEIWAYGLRNPWRFSFDRRTGDMYIGDVGERNVEEVDFEPAHSPGGVNHGWRCREGSIPYAGSTSNPCHSCDDPACPLTDPIKPYTHSDGCSVTGGYVYRGCAGPDLRGTDFYSDYCSAQLWTFRYDASTLSDQRNRTNELIPDTGSIGSVVAFGADARGEPCICDLFGGEVFRIEPAALPALHDINGDGEVRTEDYLAFEQCPGAPAAGYPECACFVFDTDGDGSVDLRDFSGFQAAFTGP